jgi:hypothetical protein
MGVDFTVKPEAEHDIDVAYTSGMRSVGSVWEKSF